MGAPFGLCVQKTPSDPEDSAQPYGESAIEADERSDGIFPLIANGKDLSKKQVLEACWFQPKVEERDERLKPVQDLAPLWLKKVTRIEALLFLVFIALLVYALLERELRLGMTRQKIERWPLYPEDRDGRAP